MCLRLDEACLRRRNGVRNEAGESRVGDVERDDGDQQERKVRPAVHECPCKVKTTDHAEKNCVASKDVWKTPTHAMGVPV